MSRRSRVGRTNGYTRVDARIPEVTYGDARIRGVVVSLALVNRIAFCSVFCAFSIIASAQNPFAPPSATYHYAPDRDYDLLDVSLDLKVDYPNRSFSGSVVNTLAALRDGVGSIRLMAGKEIQIVNVWVDGRVAQFTRGADDRLEIQTVLHKKGEVVHVKIQYAVSSAKGRSFGGGGGGWHWVDDQTGDASHCGFWTQGETDGNHHWAPLWDYPNDFATSETRVTVPADWTVIGNGSPASDRLASDKKSRTFVWKMTQPHATYLLSLCGGPFDVKKDTWRGVPLWYVVPKGRGKYIADTFGDTPDMLSFYSDVLGVKFPWPKYAQDAMYDFGGGMENVSATTLGTGELTEKRRGFWTAASVNSHELGHQWFGDYVTCQDWGQIWLNESFATFMQFIYFEHSRGRNAYDWEIDNATRAYINESERYKRPVATKLYSSQDDLFDSHTYPKGGVLLHSLRRQLGDKPFFAGLHLYLTRNAHTPVTSALLCKALTDASGINCEPFFDQWIYKPGHPVLDYKWSYDDTQKQVKVVVDQKQETKDGTPIYDTPITVGAVVGGQLRRDVFRLNQSHQEFLLPNIARPGAVILDPDHDLLREIPVLHWAPSELPFILKYSPNGPDRALAMRRLLANSPTQDSIDAVVDALKADGGANPAITSVAPLGNLKRPELRGFFESLLDHPSFDRRREAVDALAQLPQTPEEVARFRSLINPNAPIPVVAAAVRALQAWDAKGNVDVFVKAAQIDSVREQIRSAAYPALVASNSPTAVEVLVRDSKNADDDIRSAAIRAMDEIPGTEPNTHRALLDALNDRDGNVVANAARTLAFRGDRNVKPELKAAMDKSKSATAKAALKSAIDAAKD